MRAICWIMVWMWLTAGIARAEQARVVVLAEPARAGELGAAMEVALADRSVAVTSADQPGGQLRLDRAAAAQRAAVVLGAQAALWIDGDDGVAEVCAVSADGRDFRHAPLASGSPRVFATVAISLLDELADPPEGPGPAVDVDVRVDVDAAPVAPSTSGRVAAADQLASAPGVTIAAPFDAGRRSPRTVLEIGPMVSPATGGVEGEVAFALTPTMRFGVIGGAQFGFRNDLDLVLDGAIELRRVWPGARHADLGAVVGAAYAVAHEQAIVFAGPRLSYTWERASHSVAVSLVPAIATDGTSVIPSGYATLRWELPL
jgi:hypothetical protein